MRLRIASTYERWDDYREFLSEYEYEEDKVNDHFTNRYIVINSIEDLINISKHLNREVIVSNIDNETPYIEIYDGYRE